MNHMLPISPLNLESPQRDPLSPYTLPRGMMGDADPDHVTPA
uniref:Uncharacterized protein n=1 Tax=Anguilla anguilla TaxID=7936 RepID=A0A0E9VYM1_ANGAN